MDEESEVSANNQLPCYHFLDLYSFSLVPSTLSPFHRQGVRIKNPFLEFSILFKFPTVQLLLSFRKAPESDISRWHYPTMRETGLCILKSLRFFSLLCGSLTCLAIILYLISFLSSLTISPHIRDIVYHTAIKFGGIEEWEFMWQRYQDSVDPTEKSRILYALAGTKEPWLLDR